jgi:hypothetical protein
MLVTVVYLAISRYRDVSSAAAKLATIAQAGEPTSPSQAREYFLSLQTESDVTATWREVLSEFGDEQVANDFRAFFSHADVFATQSHIKNDLAADPEKLQAFVDNHRPLVDRLMAAVRKRGYVDFLDFETQNFSQEVNLLRDASRLIVCDAVASADKLDEQAFVASVESNIRLGHLLDHQPFMVSQLVRMSILNRSAYTASVNSADIHQPIEVIERTAGTEAF